MTYETLTEYGNVSEGMQIILQYVAEVSPIFIPLFLFCIFLLVALGTFIARERKGDDGDLPASFTVGVITITILAIFMRLIEGLVNGITLIICISLSALGVLWLWLSKK